VGMIAQIDPANLGYPFGKAFNKCSDLFLEQAAKKTRLIYQFFSYASRAEILTSQYMDHTTAEPFKH